MRIAYIDAVLPLRSDLTTSPVDAEWLLERAEDDDIVVILDEHGPAAELLIDAGVSVIVSAKRALTDPEIGRVTAEHSLVGRLVELDEEEPLDMVIVGPAITTDITWYAPSLARIPQVMALGGGLIERLRLIADDPELSLRHGRELWATASRLTTADALLGRANATAFGVGFPLSSLPLLDPGSEYPRLSDPPAAAEHVVVVALTDDRAGLGSLVARVAARIDIGAATSLTVVVPHVMVGGEPTGSLVMAGCPDHLATSVIVTYAGRDGAAAAFLGTADVVVASRPPDLTVNAVADRAAAGTPVILLDGAPPERSEALRPPQRRSEPRGERVLVPFDGSPGEAAAILSASQEVELAILHTGQGAELAVRLAQTDAVSGVDIAVFGRPNPLTGQPSAEVVHPYVMAVHRHAIPSILRRLAGAPTLWDLIVSSLSLSLADRVRLAILPAPLSAHVRPLPVAATTSAPNWVGGVPLLPRLNLEKAARVEPGPAKPSDVAGPPGVRDWVKTHRWSDRARLALPWKWGLLGRAMRGRW